MAGGSAVKTVGVLHEKLVFSLVSGRASLPGDQIHLAALLLRGDFQRVTVVREPARQPLPSNVSPRIQEEAGMVGYESLEFIHLERVVNAQSKKVLIDNVVAYVRDCLRRVHDVNKTSQARVWRNTRMADSRRRPI